MSKWISRVDSDYADQLLRVMDHDDWYLIPYILKLFYLLWEKFTKDRFATYYNTHCKRFNSRVWFPGTEAVNAFSQFWGNDISWLATS